MRIYYAHCLSIYNTPQEARDLAAIGQAFPGHVIVNPNNPATELAANAVRCEVESKNLLAHYKDPGHEVMARVFQPMVEGCDVLVFRALPDGRIPAGVAKEVAWARDLGKAVIELPANLLSRVMTVHETREYLHEVGQR